MPELPEVETTVRGLRKKLIGLRFTDVWSDREKPVRQSGGLKHFKKQIKGKKILKVWRRAKFIVIDIEGSKSIFVHQKISGHLMYGKWRWISGEAGASSEQSERRERGWKGDERSEIPSKVGVWVADKGPLKTDPKNQHIRVVFNLSNGYQMALSDLRRFGKVMLVDDSTAENLKEIGLLGPEPLDVSFTEFKKRFENKRGRIKQVLMDPRFVVGIGNIYADEILWQVGLHPMSRVEHLEEKDIKNIYNAMQKILELAIQKKGSSLDDYRTPSGEKGSYQNVHKAYHRTGEKCLKGDGGVIERMVIGGRSAHFCSVHQVLK
jgi:formamidopyrimidine-DNA glycosylase